MCEIGRREITKCTAVESIIIAVNCTTTTTTTESDEDEEEEEQQM
jgi:hypothetical protein